MPYIALERRPPIDEHVDKINVAEMTSGDLNYAITRLVCQWLAAHGIKYTGDQGLNAVMGVFTCAALEFYARVHRPYEALKQEDGDVYQEILFPSAQQKTPFIDKGDATK